MVQTIYGGKIISKNGSTSNKLQQKQNLLGMIAHLSDNIILKSHLVTPGIMT